MPGLLDAQTAVPPALGTVRDATVPVRRTTVPVRIDGRLDDAAWNDAQPIALAIETYPGNNTPATVRTECRIAFDTANLYVGCHAFDPAPRAIVAVRADRDDITEHD